MSNKIFQILRNSAVYDNYQTAAAAFNVPDDTTGLIDGQLKSARYIDVDKKEKAIIGIWDSDTSKWSMIDIKSSLLNYAIPAASQDASEKAYAAKEAAIAASNVTLKHDAGSLIYTLYQGTDNNKSEIGTINIPMDMVVKSGSVITATDDDHNNDSAVTVGEKYIKLNIANVDNPLYIAVHDLYKDHTAAENAKEVQIAISNDNVISATIVNVDASTVTLKDPENNDNNKNLNTAWFENEKTIAAAFNDLNTKLDSKTANGIKVPEVISDNTPIQNNDSINTVLNKLYARTQNSSNITAGNGIALDGTTVTAVAKTNDNVIEVTKAGIGIKDDAIWDCGTY